MTINTFYRLSVMLGRRKISFSSLDSTTMTEYNNAIVGASLGSKRQAGATAIINALSPNNRLIIFQDSVEIIRIEYSDNVTLGQNSSDVWLSPGTISTVTISSGTLTSGVWTFDFLGGSGFTRKISGTVGPMGSSKNLVIAGNPSDGAGLITNFRFMMPRPIDNK